VSTSDDAALREQMQRVESLIQEVDRFPDRAARATTQEIIQGLLDYHGAGIARILEHLAEAGEAGQAIRQRLAKDELVGSLLLLYGLHPLDLEARVRQALEQVRPYLRSHGGNVELIEMVDGTVRLRMEGSCHGCPSSAATLRTTIEEAIFNLAPDVAGIEVEGVTPPPAEAAASFVPVEQLTLLKAHSV
jgi:Fe-S cluster biogenesis protein NfuA